MMAITGRVYGHDASLTDDSRGPSSGCKHAQNACAASNIEDLLAPEQLRIGHDGISVGLCAGLHSSTFKASVIVGCLRLLAAL